MLATHAQIAYALQSCAFGLSVEATGDTAALLLLDCQRAIKDARTEAARYAGCSVILLRTILYTALQLKDICFTL